MDKYEIERYIVVGREKSVIIDRRPISKYPGLVRDITIKEGHEVIIEYNCVGYDEGGLTLYLTYCNYDDLVDSLEKYLNKKIIEWENYSTTEYYPNIIGPFDMVKSGVNFTKDFVNDNLHLPMGYIKKRLPGGYWKDIYMEKHNSID